MGGKDTEKEPKPRQQRLPGMTPKKIQELQDKAEEMKGYETDRIDAQNRENKARTELTELMKAARLTVYDLDDEREIVLEKKVTEEKAYVRKKKSAKGGRKKKSADSGDDAATGDAEKSEAAE